VAGNGNVPQASIIPADVVRKFLAAANVTPGHASDVKASVVRVICVRK
jgi:hypothetical protein